MRAIILLFAIVTICIHNGQTEHVIRHNGKNYYLSAPAKADWWEAFRTCRQKGYDLVEVQDIQLHNKFVQTIGILGYTGTDPGWWIGGFNNYNLKNGYFWTRSGNPFTFSYWAKDQPNNFKNDQYCVEIELEFGLTNNWNDERCTEKNFYICGPRLK